MSTERHIHIRNFGRFQRFQDRRPTWIRLHLDLVDNDAFLGLTDHQQAVLISMWIAYAKSVSRDAEGTFKCARSLPEDTRKLGRRIGRRVRKDTVDSLLAAGFLVLLETETVTLGDGSGSLEVKKLDKNLARAREEDQHPAVEARLAVQAAPATLLDATVPAPEPSPEERHRIAEQIRAQFAALATPNGAEPSEDWVAEEADELT